MQARPFQLNTRRGKMPSNGQRLISLSKVSKLYAEVANTVPSALNEFVVLRLAKLHLQAMSHWQELGHQFTVLRIE